jgi:hypothetical protein
MKKSNVGYTLFFGSGFVYLLPTQQAQVHRRNMQGYKSIPAISGLIDIIVENLLNLFGARVSSSPSSV